MASDRIVSLLGDQADYLLKHTCTKVRKEDLHLPSPKFVDDYFISSNRNNPPFAPFSRCTEPVAWATQATSASYR
ncbi:MAG: hypothetical protein ABR83_04335 [Cryomorphaceae bacterium BACL18 MAG-120924-bin36]|nr:MAG: hypothetical protein ABR83_04335 [Cryomorphaceae bacterium BACL18 MAG-120924-bin36]